MRKTIYILISEWGREDGLESDVVVFTSLNAAQERMRKEYESYMKDYASYSRADISYYCNEYVAGISVDGNYDYMHDSWLIVEKEVEFEDDDKRLTNNKKQKHGFWAKIKSFFNH